MGLSACAPRESELAVNIRLSEVAYCIKRLRLEHEIPARDFPSYRGEVFDFGATVAYGGGSRPTIDP